VVAEDGAVYTCGYGPEGQLGLGNGHPRRRLTRVPQAVFAGSRLAHNGGNGGGARVPRHWTCGYNGNGQLGVGHGKQADV